MSRCATSLTSDPIGAGCARRLRAVLLAVVLATSAAGLAGPREALCACRQAAAGDTGTRVRWLRAGAAEDAASLDRWCAAVGGPLLVAPGKSPAPAGRVDALAVVVWNVKLGAGALERLIADLRAGELSEGRPVEHFVLLLQEVVRVGGPVPAVVPAGARFARAVAGPADPSRSIEVVAARTGLFAFYAPSMRNGAERPEDRGNAILSTLALSDPVAIELPYERQRRVSVSAWVSVALRTGKLFPLRLVSAHLDHTSSAVRFWRSFGAGRTRQARALLELLADGEPVVLGGDLNTWFGESREEAVGLLRTRLVLPARLPAAATYAPPFGLPERQVDYLLAQLPETWEVRYRVAPDRRHSDHAPLIGWIEPRSKGSERQEASGNGR